MRSRTATWFECKIAFEKVMEDGLQKKVVEQYVVDALSYAEAENRIIEEFCRKREQCQARLSNAECSSKSTEGQMSVYISGELASPSSVTTQDSSSELGSPSLLRQFEVKDLKKAPYKEIFFDDQDPQADRYYKAKLEFITTDERTEKEKRSRVTYLVQASDLHRAMKNVDEVMSGTMIDYEACCIDDTKIIDVFEYQKQQADSDTDNAAALMARMAEDLKDRSLTVESIVDKYVSTATPELRQQLIDRLNQMRQSGQVPEKE